MTRFKTTLGLAALLGITSPTFAAFQDMSLGARPQGMGGAFLAVANDANAVFWNPAGLTQLRRQNATFMHGLIADVAGLNIDYLGYAMPMEKGTFGLGWLNLGATLEQGANDDTSRFSENTFFISGAFKSGILNDDDFSVGVNIKRLAIASDLEDGAGMAFDVGLLFKAHKHLNIAAVGRNLAADVKDENFPAYFKVGLAAPVWDDRIHLAVDVDSKDNIEGKEGLNVRYHVGAEAQVVEMFALRAGFDNGDLTAGAGFGFSGVKIDYAYRASEIFGAYHRVSLGSSFGQLVGEEKKKKEPKPVKKKVKKVSKAKAELKELGLQVEDSGDDGESVKIILSGANALKFPSGSAKLDSAAKSALTSIAKALNKYPDRKIKISGYSDNQGAESVNIELSGYRADVVRQHLILNGVDTERISSTKGFGPEAPVASNDTEDGRRANRRVEITLE